MNLTYQVRETTGNRLIKTLDSEKEAVEFLKDRNADSYLVWSVNRETGRVVSIIRGTNFTDMTIHYEPEKFPVKIAGDPGGN